MDKICEFCLALRPMVFCKSDSAFLCLTCDSRVHSANALVGKHPRVLLCESCGARAAFVVCLDHQLILCKACDGKLHQMRQGGEEESGDISSNSSSDANAVCKQHRRKMVSSFTGCPTAKQFAALWGIEAAGGGDSGTAAVLDRDGLLGGVGESVVAGSSELYSDVDSSNQTSAAKDSRIQQQSQLQQILGLKKLQLNDGSSSSPMLTCERLNSTISTTANHHLDDDDDDDPEQQQQERSQPLFEMDYMSTTPSMDDESSSADPFLWQSESTLEDSSQFWSQNLEELGGMCQELDCYDDFNIPEVDMTFRNFEDLLGSDEDLSRALSDDTVFHSADKDYDVSGNNHARSSSNMSMNESNEEAQSTYDEETLKFIDFSSTSMIRPSYAASLSFSRLSSDSSGDYMDCGSSTPWKSDDQQDPTKGGKKTKQHERTTTRKGKLDMNKRIKSRFAKLGVSETKPVKVTRSF